MSDALAMDMPAMTPGPRLRPFAKFKSSKGNIMAIVVSQLILTTVVLVGFSVETLSSRRTRRN